MPDHDNENQPRSLLTDPAEAHKPLMELPRYYFVEYENGDHNGRWYTQLVTLAGGKGAVMGIIDKKIAVDEFVPRAKTKKSEMKLTRFDYANLLFYLSTFAGKGASVLLIFDSMGYIDEVRRLFNSCVVAGVPIARAIAEIAVAFHREEIGSLKGATELDPLFVPVDLYAVAPSANEK